MTASAVPMPKEGILQIEPYVPGRSKLPGAGKIVKLSSNETPFGPSPKALNAYKAVADNLERYPDGSSQVLRDAIASLYGLNAERIVCGAGSDELLNLLAHAYLGPGDEAIHTEHGFLVYKIAILANGADPVIAPEVDYTANIDSILKCVSERTKLVFLANPNNPTGTYVPFDDVRRLREALPSQAVLVLDGAYAEYVRRNDYESGLELVATTENTVMTRTFSKIYGLASLRIGWAYCPGAIADVLNRIRGPFNLSGPAIAAGAAAIVDTAHTQQAVLHNEKWLEQLTQDLHAMGLEVTPSVANFVLIHFPEREGFRAKDADSFLCSRRIVLRRVENYGLPNALRMTVGTEEENLALISALGEFMKGGAAQ